MDLSLKLMVSAVSIWQTHRDSGWIDGNWHHQENNRPGYPAELPIEGLYRRSSLTLVIDKETKASLKGQRTYKELEDLAVKMFNDDDTIKANKGNNYFTKESWTQEVNL